MEQKDSRNFFAVKATPNPYLINILQEYGCGCDCSSMTELMMAKALGCREGDIMFSSNDTPEKSSDMQMRSVGSSTLMTLHILRA